ncbi:MAG: M23 family metallopeptidase [Myxococcales bacterium]|nr:M23 family metallopeptidase [Myxococcales bacterium]
MNNKPRRPEPVSIPEMFGVTAPISRRLAEVRLALGGDKETPKTLWGPSSLKIMKPRLSFPLWLGRAPKGRLVPIYNLFNYRQPPPEKGWSVRVTDVEDFLGTKLTYDSHNATDFAVPPGTVVVAAAPGLVVRVSSEFNRGGLKVFIDHGRGLITTSNHLARALVRPGDTVSRGQPVALSGYSGIDAVVTFPWGTPHVHFNTWLDGAYVDPFAKPGAVSLWRNGNWPTPHKGDTTNDEWEPTKWDHGEIARAIRACKSDEARREILAFENEFERAAALLFMQNYYPSRFSERVSPYRTTHERAPWLDLPLSHEDYDGVWFPHGVEPPRP